MLDNDVFSELKDKNNTCMLGGLGDVELFVDLLDALERDYGIVPKKYVLITSPEIHEKFKKGDLNLDKVRSEIYEFDFQTVLREDIQKLKIVFKDIIDKIEKNHEIICDITGGTKPVSIALMSIATEKKLLKIYFSGRHFIKI
ncbi:MAG: DUF1887 family protein [Candidatus Lokiarchaeota archaeon]|nr:DUF1887 family protein [Candidatus Lokiarchaeota archaeon]